MRSSYDDSDKSEVSLFMTEPVKPEYLSRFGTLVSCFVHERKHKVIKRFASQKADTQRGFEESLLKDVLAVQLKATEQQVPSTEARLLKKTPAPRKLKNLIHEITGAINETVYHAPCAVHGGGFECSRGDVVVLCLLGSEQVGRIQFHAEVCEITMTCVLPWRHVDSNIYKVPQDEQTQSVLVCTSDILCCCVWSQKADAAIVLSP